jgi:hypothetical protein
VDGAGFGPNVDAGLGAVTSDPNAFASESESGGSGASSAFETRSFPIGGAFPAGGTLPTRGAAAPAPGVGPGAPPFRPSSPSRDVFLPCLAMRRIMAFARAVWQ